MPRHCFASLLFLIIAGIPAAFAATEARLVRDINDSAGQRLVAPDKFVEDNDGEFVAFGSGGPWISDGSPEGTRQLRELDASDLVFWGGYSWFVSPFHPNENSVGARLWRTNGTSLGTMLVGDFGLAPDVTVDALVALDNALVIIVQRGETWEVWASDGTPDGTDLLFTEDADWGEPVRVTAVDDTVILATVADGDEVASRIYSFGLASAAPSLAADLGLYGVAPTDEPMLAWGNFVYFLSYRPEGAGEFTQALWRSDGTESGTIELHEFGATSEFASASDAEDELEMVLFDNQIILAAGAAEGTELWLFESGVGVRQVMDIQAGSGSSRPGNFVADDSGVWFSATTAEEGTELWRTDGSSEDTTLIADVEPGAADGAVKPLAMLDGWLYFTAGGDTELWRSNASTTEFVTNLDMNANVVAPRSAQAALGRLFFTAGTANEGIVPWSTDGTVAGTEALIEGGVTASSNPVIVGTPSGAFPRVVYAAAETEAEGVELWVSDGTEAGTTLTRDINPGPASSSPSSMAAIDHRVLFAADDGSSGVELWISDGTEAGTTLVKDIHSGSASSSPSNLTVHGDQVYFVAFTPDTGTELWVSDGTGSGTRLVADINPGDAFSAPASLTSFGTDLFFTAHVDGEGRELWKTDGTEAGTVVVEELAGSDELAPMDLIVIGDLLVFESTTTETTWSSDGTSSGTAQFFEGPLGPTYHLFGETLYFESESDLWRTNGTASGTLLLEEDIFHSTGSDRCADGMAVLAEGVAFVGYSQATGCEVYWTDGNDTMLLSDIFPGRNGSRIPWFDDASFWHTTHDKMSPLDLILFSADDGEHGVELWSVDHLIVDRLTDIAPAGGSSWPRQLTPLGEMLFFTADSPTAGTEMFVIDIPAELVDTDGDFIGDMSDAFPANPAESRDSDGDGVGDNADAFPYDAGISADADGDGVADDIDAFPANPAEWADSDGDGVGDNADDFPNDPARILANRIDNISTRGLVRGGDEVLIGGLIIQGSTPKQVLIRARGPSLAAKGVDGVLLDPRVQLFDAGGNQLDFNDNWADHANHANIPDGMRPVEEVEAGILVTLPPGAYTAIVRGVGQAQGIGIVEIIDVDNTDTSQIVNISTRGYVGTGDNVLIGGVVVDGEQPQTLTIRARGPSLAEKGVANTLSNPRLQVFDSDGTLIDSNDDWQAHSTMGDIPAHLAPTDEREAALTITLEPGAYTAIVRGVDGATGVGMIEAYNVD